MVVVLAVMLAIVTILATILIFLQQRAFNKLKGECDEILTKWDNTIDRSHNDALRYEAEILSLKREVSQLKEQNVSRETSYNKSYGTPEVINWVEQQYTGEDVNRG